MSETVADNNTLKYKAIIEEKEKRIAKLETEMAELKRKYEEEECRKAVNEAEYLSSNKPSPLSLRIAKGKETSVLVTLDGMHKAGWIEGATRDEAIKEISLKLFGKEISTPAQRVSNARNTANPHIYKEAIEKAKEETENVLENLEDMEKYLLKKKKSVYLPCEVFTYTLTYTPAYPKYPYLCITFGNSGGDAFLSSAL